MNTTYQTGGYRERGISTPARQSQVAQIRTGGVSVTSPRSGFTPHQTFRNVIRNHQLRGTDGIAYHPPPSRVLVQQPVVLPTQPTYQSSYKTFVPQQGATINLIPPSTKPTSDLTAHQRTPVKPATLAGLVQQAAIHESSQPAPMATTPRAGLYQMGSSVPVTETSYPTSASTTATVAPHQVSSVSVPVVTCVPTNSFSQPLNPQTALVSSDHQHPPTRSTTSNSILDHHSQHPQTSTASASMKSETDELKLRCFEAENRSEKLQTRVAELEKENQMLVAALKAIEDNHIRNEAERMLQRQKEANEKKAPVEKHKSEGSAPVAQTDWSKMLNSISTSQETMLQSLEMRSNLSKKLNKKSGDSDT
eukprot:TRINITY_DN17883_c0_g1_i1.p1 TRINITY_DN17883_c0_g1~~TRINITY_DN17883_c0_g1_i1.p1  ORF type:complete len:364 (+),score=76.46 TRINITY_DN17883_c0_g1_i1:77-1168(+)